MNQESIKIQWEGPEREIPGIGLVNEGHVILIDRLKGLSFISQGLAKQFSDKTVTIDYEEGGEES